MSLRGRGGSSSIILPPDLLKDVSVERLEELANKEEEFLTFFTQLDLDQTKEIQRKRDEITNANRELSLSTTDRRPVFEQKKSKLLESSQEAAQLKEEYERKYEQSKSLSVGKDRAAIYQELQQAVKEAEKESEKLADQYLDGMIQMAPDQFIQQFLSDRSTYWSRKVKVEKMDVIMKQPLPYPVATPAPPKPAPYQPKGVQPVQSMPVALGVSSGPPLPPPYASLAGPYRNNPTQPVSASYNPRPMAPPTSSMHVPGGYPGQQHAYRQGYPGQQQGYPGQQQGYPTASYRPTYPNPSSSYGGGGAPGSYSGGIYQQAPYYPDRR